MTNFNRFRKQVQNELLLTNKITFTKTKALSKFSSTIKIVAFLSVLFFSLLSYSSYSQCGCAGTIKVDVAHNTSASFPTGFTSTLVSVETNFTILTGTTFIINAAELKICPGVKIIVSQGATLKLTSSSTTQKAWLHACNDMWDGISILGGSGNEGKLISNNGTLIEDAEHAVFVDNLSQGIFQVNNTIFNRNWRNIFVNHTGLNYDFASSYITNSFFYCRTNAYTLSNCSCLASPHIGNRSLSGAEMQRLNSPSTPYFQIGNSNTFDNMQTGVDISQSYIDVVQNTITNCDIGVRLQFDTYAIVEDNTIYRCNIGIEAFNGVVDFEVLRNNIYSIDVDGIFYHDTQVLLSNIENNSFTDIGNEGILISNIPTTADFGVKIVYNEFYNSVLTPALATGVLFTQPVIFPDINFEVTQNTFGGFQHGVFVSNVDLPWVRGNDITVPVTSSNPGYNLYGIHLENCLNAWCFHNRIYGDVQHVCNDWYHGIEVENSTQAYIYCNEMTDFERELIMAGGVNQTEVMGNKFNGEPHYSLYIDQSGLGLGDQGAAAGVFDPSDPGAPSDNEWNGNADCNIFLGNEIYSVNSNNASGGFTKFYVRNNPSNFIPNIIDFSGGNISLPPVLLTTFPAETICQRIRGEGGQGGEHEGERVLNGLDVTLLPARNNTFGIAIAQNTMGWQAGDNSAKWFAENSLYHFIETDSATGTDSIFINWYNNQQASSYYYLRSISSAIADTLYSSAQSLISSFNPANGVESYLKDMLQIENDYQSSLPHTINATQKTTIDNIALLCPFNDGPAVYMARSLRMIIDQFNYSYTASCNTSSANKNFIKPIADVHFVLNESNLSNMLKQENAISFAIYDLNGKLILKNKIGTDLQNMLCRGFYICKIFKVNNEVRIYKLIY